MRSGKGECPANDRNRERLPREARDPSAVYGNSRQHDVPVIAVPRQEYRYRDDVAISYEVEGTGPTPIVFLHGFAAALTTWDDIRGFFPLDRFSLYFLDLKGFGRSSKPRDGAYGPADQAEVVTAFLANRELRRAILIGHSLGGCIALLTLLGARASGKGDLVGGLVLIDSAAYPQSLPPVMRSLAIPPLGWCILHLLPTRFMVRFTLTHLFRNRQAITQERIARYTACFGDKGATPVFVDTCRHLASERYTTAVESYPTITVPTLVIWGREDPLINANCGVRLHRDIPGSRLVIIDGCGHVPQEERPAETWAPIADFLNDFFSTVH
jgi:pimeloyl-ACP methyl ester carboxylesterase